VNYGKDRAMSVSRWLCWMLCTGLALACEPEDKCSGELYYNGTSCQACPADAMFEDEHCVCIDSERYEFEAGACVLKADASLPSEPDAGPSAAACGDYCEFMQTCIGANPLAQAGLGDVVEALHADDPVACASSCQELTDSEADENVVLACIEQGREDAACAGDETQAGLTAAFTLIGTCCTDRTDDPLCREICEALTANAFVGDSAEFCRE
jgi:hypothetical protein